MKSSTETELVLVDNLMPQILWMRYFLEYQGVAVIENGVYQINQSSINLENNGWHQLGNAHDTSISVTFL